MIYLIFKRFLDTIIAFIGLLILSPLFLIIMLLIKIDSKGPIFFKQKRIGKNKKNFFIIKFRTMKIETPKNTPTHLLKNPQKWITKIGKFLRKTSLDELPQIINILKGDMSIVGPRAALWNQYDLLKERDKYDVYKLYPGLTGYAQIKGRDQLTIHEKAILDGYYAANLSFWLDVNIFFGTIIKILKSEDIVEGEKSKFEKINNRDNQ